MKETELATYPSQVKARTSREALATDVKATYDPTRDIYVYDIDNRQHELAIITRKYGGRDIWVLVRRVN